MAVYFRNPHQSRHHTGAHPENSGRIAAIEAHLAARELQGLEVVDAEAAATESIERIHPADYRRSIERLAAGGGGAVDADTAVSEGSYLAALHAAGAAVEAVDRVAGGEARFAFCGVRPPGHHAERSRAMGFCLFNNVAIAAAHARAEYGVERVAIVDWDVHHGNGTQAIFYDDPAVLFFSVHQSPLFPGTGRAEEVGEGEGRGYTINVPLSAGSSGADFREAIDAVAIPRIREHEPGILFVSAGFDAHRDDPLADCDVSTADFGAMARSLAAVAEDLEIAIVATLEGGYDPAALAESVEATILGFRPTA